jgi:hypothetical protein
LTAAKLSRLFVFFLAASFILPSIADARMRARNFYMEQLESDTVVAAANGRGCLNPIYNQNDTDEGTMIYQATMDAEMLDQLDAVLYAGGAAKIVFSMRSGYSVVGFGNAMIDGEVTVDVGGSTIFTKTYTGEAQSPADNRTDQPQVEVPIDMGVVAGMSIGDTITVMASGSGEANANGCDSSDQAIVHWYFSSGGKPFLATSPWGWD